MVVLLSGFRLGRITGLDELSKMETVLLLPMTSISVDILGTNVSIFGSRDSIADRAGNDR